MTEPAEILGIVAIATMVTSYALEKRSTLFIATFAAGCALAAVYAYLIDSYPFLIAEALWAVIAFRRWYVARRTVQPAV
jgi:hypothetical protein